MEQGLYKVVCRGWLSGRDISGTPDLPIMWRLGFRVLGSGLRVWGA